MGESVLTFDVAVVGGGPAGYTAALQAAGRGARTCCIESGQLGGTCLNSGCIPTKMLLHAGRLAFEHGSLSRWGLSVAGRPAVDGLALHKSIADTVSELRQTMQDQLQRAGVSVIPGRGCLRSPGDIEVTGAIGVQAIQARQIILATGSRPIRPDWLEGDSPRFWDTDDATAADELPDSVIIVGGGAVGCEFATLFGSLGVTTTLVEIRPSLLQDLGPEVSRLVERSLRERRVEMLTGVGPLVANDDGRGVVVRLDDSRSLRAERLLVAVGRRANIEGLGLEPIGVRQVQGIIEVDACCRTSVRGIFAAGDVAERRQYAHLAMRMGVVAADNATGHPNSDGREVVPACVYTDPQVATVGLQEEQARRQGLDIATATVPLRANVLARARGQTQGLVKLVANVGSGRLVGATIIAPDATEIIQEVVLALRHGLRAEDLASCMHPHPTIVEALHQAACILQYGRRDAHA